LPDSELERVATLSTKDELTDHLVYQRLAGAYKTKKPEFSKALDRLAAAENKHYQFWSRYTKEPAKSPGFKVSLVLLLRLLLGTTFAVRYLEKDEKKVIAMYISVAESIPEGDRAAFQEMLDDEIEHENLLANQLEGSAVRYISFIILGLADAIVEISGIHAGSLGIYKSTEITGLAGIVAGAAASIAMASAAFAQAKQGFKGKPSLSALFTGLSYFVNAVVLATPYFLTSDKFLALGTSVTLAIVIVAFINYYNSVVSGTNFLRDFGELAGIMLGATGALYLFGLLVSAVFGITTPSL